MTYWDDRSTRTAVKSDVRTVLQEWSWKRWWLIVSAVFVGVLAALFLWVRIEVELLEHRINDAIESTSQTALNTARNTATAGVGQSLGTPSPAASSNNRRAEKAKEQDMRRYIRDHLDISDVDARYFTSVYRTQRAGLKLTVKNTGDRTVNRIELRIYFLDADKQRLSEQTIIPFSTERWSDPDPPLRPGYVWESGDDQFFPLDAPSGWYEGSIEIAVTEIAFAE